jgi:hypothetical protein
MDISAYFRGLLWGIINQIGIKSTPKLEGLQSRSMGVEKRVGEHFPQVSMLKGKLL